MESLSAVGTLTMEKSGEFLIEKLKEYGRIIIKKKKLTKTLKKEISFLFDNVQNGDFFNNFLSNVFDDDNIKKIVKKIVDSNGYNFVDIFLVEIENRLNDSEVDYTAVKRISNFLTVNLINYLKKKDSNFYNNYITEENYQRLIKVDNDLKLVLNQNKQIYELLREPKYYDIYTYEKNLKKSTNPSIDLEFFEQQDDLLINYIKSRIDKNENMLFWGLSKHEILYTLLWAFKKIGKKLYVFNDKNDWEKIKNSSVRGAFLIPFFDTDEILNLTNNTSVIIKESGNYINDGNAFRICRRNQEFIVEKMKKYTDDIQGAYDLVNESTGFFYPLMESLFPNAMIDKPYSVDIHHIKAVSIAILINQWTEDSEDKKLIEKLYGGPYSNFFDDIFQYLYDAKRDLSSNLNPIFIRKNNRYGYKDVVAVISQKKSYKDLIHKISASVWDNYYSNLEELFSKKIVISEEMVEGILNSLSLIICSNSSNIENTPKISLIIKKYLDYIYDNDEWVEFSNHVSTIVEIAPNKTIEYLNKAIDNRKVLFLDLFDNTSNNYHSYNKYCSYLFALEKMSVLEEYYLEVIDILFKLNDLSIEYTISNSPKQVLNSIFCPWINVSCLYEYDKITLLESNIKKYKNALQIVYDNLPNKNSCISSFAHLKFRKHKIINSSVPINVVYECYIQYLELFINNCKDNSMLIDLVEELKFYPIETLNNIKDNLLNHINLMEDSVKVSFKNKIRELIYHCKFFKSWSISDDVISYFEFILNEIQFNIKEYDYIYIFSDDFSFPILNPIPFEEDNYSITNEKRAEEERINKIEEFKAKGLSLETLLKIYNESEVGYYIDLLLDEKAINKKLDFLVEKCSNKRTIIIYLISLLRSSDDKYYEAIEYLKDVLSLDASFISDALSIHSVDDKFLEYCSNLDKNVLSLLWIKRVNHYSNITVMQIEKVLECIIKYGNLSSYIEFLMDISRYISKEKLYEYMTNISYEFIMKEEKISNNLDYYYLERLLSVIYPIAISKKDNIDLFAYLELRFSNLLDHRNLRFLNYVVSHDPKFYYELVTNVYTKKCNSRISSLYFNLYFCPGYCDGIFNEALFEEWMHSFTELMSSKKEKEMMPHVVGKLLAYSPNENDKIPLMKPVREYIENNYSDSLLSSFVCAELNKRGIYSMSAGKEEKNYSNIYKQKALLLKKQSCFKCSYIYTAISNDYEYQSEYEAYMAKFE